jgi:hypothetical protein
MLVWRESVVIREKRSQTDSLAPTYVCLGRRRALKGNLQTRFVNVNVPVAKCDHFTLTKHADFLGCTDDMELSLLPYHLNHTRSVLFYARREDTNKFCVCAVSCG